MCNTRSLNVTDHNGNQLFLMSSVTPAMTSQNYATKDVWCTAIPLDVWMLIHVIVFQMFILELVFYLC